MTEEEELAFEAEHGVEVHAAGSTVVARWGMALAVTFMGIGFVSFLLSYFYLRLENPAWPPIGIPDPGLRTVTITTLLMVAGGFGMWRALQSIRAGNRSGLQGGVVAALALAGTALALQFAHVAGLEFDSQSHAYGSIFHALSGFAFAVTLTALVMAAMTLVWANRGYYSPRRYSRVANVAGFWAATVTVWIVAFGTLHLVPYLT